MDLIERYVYAVGRHLPRKNREDIQNELRSLLVDTLEGRLEGEPGEDDVVALLKEFGPPEKVAASYWPENQYLIGPGLYPIFRPVVGIMLGVIVVLHLIAFGVTLFFEVNLSPLDVVANLLQSVLGMFGMVVLIFALLQRFEVRPGAVEKPWNPRDLPAVEEIEPIDKVGTIVGIALGLVFLAALNLFRERIGYVVGFDERFIPYDFIVNPVIVSHLPWINAAVLLSLGLDMVLLYQGRWQVGTRAAKIALNLFGAYVLYLLLDGHAVWLAQKVGTDVPLLVNMSPILQQAEASDIPLLLGMQAMRGVLVLALIATLGESAKMAYHLVRRLVGAAPSSGPVPAEKAVSR